MLPQTAATLASLDEAHWFSHVGIHDTTSAIVLASWQEAIDQCHSAAWKDLCLEAANQYRARLVERSVERFREWNAIVISLKPFTMPFVERKIAPVVREHNLPKRFANQVQWDILHLCMECEYADVYSPGFYASQAYWYVKGHFPCGWQGVFPSGKLLIY